MGECHSFRLVASSERPHRFMNDDNSNFIILVLMLSFGYHNYNSAFVIKRHINNNNG